MDLREKRVEFEKEKRIYDSALLKFKGLDGFLTTSDWDVYNCSIPFDWEGERYIYGRVERREEWARSFVKLFRETAPDEWTAVNETMTYQLEDPYIAKIGNELVMGGTHVRYSVGKIDTYYGYFYRGTNIGDLRYFTTGPDNMKDIRLVELEDGRIGVFSRPRRTGLAGGAGAMIGFTVINSLDELTPEIINNAPYIHGLFGEGEWGGPNQAYALSSGKIGVIGHMSYTDMTPSGIKMLVYMNSAFVLDPENREVLDFRLIGTRPCYPACPSKKPDLADCTFTSGIVPRADKKFDLYAGVGDAFEGRLTIDNPFSGYGEPIIKL